jgi:hypothetical protein
VSSKCNQEPLNQIPSIIKNFTQILPNSIEFPILELPQFLIQIISGFLKKKPMRKVIPCLIPFKYIFYLKVLELGRSPPFDQNNLYSFEIFLNKPKNLLFLWAWPVFFLFPCRPTRHQFSPSLTATRSHCAPPLPPPCMTERRYHRRPPPTAPGSCTGRVPTTLARHPVAVTGPLFPSSTPQAGPPP